MLRQVRRMHVAALGAVAQRMLHHDQRQHRLGDRRRPDADAGVVAALGHHLDRRRPGTSRHVTQRNEPDAVQSLSGVYEG